MINLKNNTHEELGVLWQWYTDRAPREPWAEHSRTAVMEEMERRVTEYITVQTVELMTYDEFIKQMEATE